MRELSVEDLRWVAGGLPASGSENEIINENGRWYQYYGGQWHEVVEPVYVSPGEPGDPEWPDPEWPDDDDPAPGTPLGPNCGNSNTVDWITAPDNATYYAPENVTNQTILDAINHLASITDWYEKLVEFKDMYENPQNPFFIDFKDWGTDNGPVNSISAGTVTYYSGARGEMYTGKAFEAFGNYMYGFIGILGGIHEEELFYAAGWVQTGNNLIQKILGMDGVEDRPHVMKGVLDALSYRQTPRNILNIVDEPCS